MTVPADGVLQRQVELVGPGDLGPAVGPRLAWPGQGGVRYGLVFTEAAGLMVALNTTR